MTGPAIDKQREALAISILMLTVALLFLIGSVLLASEQARIVPLSVLIPLVPLLGVALWRTTKEWPSRDAASVPSVSTSELQVVAWILALPTLVTTMGMVAGAAIFVTLWLRRRSGENWAVSIAAGLAAAAALWMLGATVVEGLTRGGLLWSLVGIR